MAVTERRTAGLDVERVRADFPILSRTVGDRPLVYLDSTATSQKPRQVLDAERDFYERHNANVHRGIYMLSEEATELYEGARGKIEGFIGAADPDTVIFNRGTTESINAIAHGWGRKFLKGGDEILLTDMEHHSNIVPWQLAAKATGATLRYIPITDEGLLDLTDLGSLLTEKTKVFAVTGGSNSLGTLPPVRQLADAAHAVGALLVVDGAQLVPHVPVDVAELDCDFLTISGHKMLGPTASGGFYAKRELLEEMDPFIGGGHMIHEVFHEYSTWQEVPGKFEGGTMNIAQEVGLAAAVDYLEELGMENVRAHEEEIAGYALERLLGAGARIFGPTDTSVRGGAVSFWYKEIHPHDLATVLNEEGIAVRAGHHCNQLVMRRFGVPATTRASFYVYNTKQEVDALIEALGKAESVFGN